MNGRKRVRYSFMALLIALLVPIGYGNAQVAPTSESQKCLECHGKRGVVKKFENNESIEVYVDSEKLARSVHNSLACSQCHTDFSKGQHPKRRFRSKEHYETKASLTCRQCHTGEQIKSKAIHARLLKEEGEGKSHPCTNCHGSHSVTRMGSTPFKNEEQYCLKCHGYELDLVFKNGETLPIKIDISSFQESVHKKLSCSDCHFGFSDVQHPKRNFRSPREFSIAHSETCRRCHFDKYTKTMESIHYDSLSQGQLNAPVCTDCHGSHAIAHFGKEKARIVQRCQRCHPGVYEIYAKSVHGKALFDELNQDVPVCIDCHTAHDIKDPLTLDYRERIPEMCSNCHANKALAIKYGLSTDVVKTYLSDFHGVTLRFYRKQREEHNKPARGIAVCTDCHGTHSISSMRGTDPAIVKANLLKRCEQCHAGAPKNFPDTWLSHYEPSLTKAPMVFLVNSVYKVFIVIMAIGLIVQILLHIWRYAVNR